MHIIWLKRDLRITDHAAFQAAAGAPCILLYIDEPELWAQPDASMRHRRFIAQSLAALQEECTAHGFPLLIAHGDATDIFSRIYSVFPDMRIFSHVETGNAWSFTRDQAVAAWAQSRGVAWHEFAQNGVQRGLRERRGWAANWEKRMREPLLERPTLAEQTHSFAAKAKLAETLAIPDNGITAFAARAVFPAVIGARTQQPGGAKAGTALLNSFLAERAESYRFAISRPEAALRACSRLSPHISFGTISLRTIVQAARQHVATLDSQDPRERGMHISLTAFLARLHWHCHFIQKLESFPALEFRNMHSAYDDIVKPVQPALLQAWSEGTTGFPFIDACMRALRRTGWMNFRMRALLCSFASYQLWLPWQTTALHLAREFTDYEPGIHWSQMQMQSGTTGINVIRMYNPIKQSRDQDPRGTFIRRYCPELSRLSDEAIHAPWECDRATLQHAGIQLGSDYPAPIVDHLATAAYARDTLWAVRSRPGFREEAADIQRRLGSRASGLSAAARGAAKRRGTPKPRPQSNIERSQLSIFDQAAQPDDAP